MAKVRIKVQPSGLINGQPWPAVGDKMDLPDAVAEGMASAGMVEYVGKREAPETATHPAVPEERDLPVDADPREDLVKTARSHVEDRDIDVPPANATDGDVEVKWSDEDEGNGIVPVDDPADGALSFTADVEGDSPPAPDVPPVTSGEVEVDVTVSDLEDGNGTVPAEPVDEQIDDATDPVDDKE